MRIWGKIIKDNHLVKDTVVLLEGSQRRTLKIFEGLRLKDAILARRRIDDQKRFMWRAWDLAR